MPNYPTWSPDPAPRNYEDEMNRGFEEIQEIKRDIENKQEIYETQQIRDLRREMKRSKTEFSRQVHHVRMNSFKHFFWTEKGFVLCPCLPGPLL